MRRWLQALLKANIVHGSVEAGVSVHDLVREVMIRRLDKAAHNGEGGQGGHGGLRTTQREAVPLLIAAYDAGGPSAGYAAASLHWHVRQALDPDAWTLLSDRTVRTDPVVKVVLTHDAMEIRRQGALGIGIEKLRTAADVCDAAGEHLEAAELMFAAASCFPGNGVGAELNRAWASLMLLEKVDPAARVDGGRRAQSIELKVLPALLVSTAYTFGTPEHNALLARLQATSEASGAALTGSFAPGEAPTLTPAQVVESEMGTGGAAIFAAFGVEGILGDSTMATVVFTGADQPADKVVESHGKLREATEAYVRAAAASQDGPSRHMCRVYSNFIPHFLQRSHALPEFHTWHGGAVDKGAKLKKTIETYDFDSCHPVAKSTGFNSDFFSFGIEALFLLLFSGDMSAARAGAAKAVEVHRRILERVDSKQAVPDSYPFEAFNAPGFLISVLLLMGDTATLRQLLQHSLMGRCVTDGDETHKAQVSRRLLRLILSHLL